MDAPVTAFLGAMGPLIWKLEVLLLKTSEDEPIRWPRLPKGVRDGIDHLKDDLEEISTYLEDLSELEDPPLTAKCWMKEVRELSYDMEDYIDNLARHSCRTNVKTRSVCKISHVELNRLPRRKKVTWHKQVRIKISEFRIRVQEANQRHKRYELDCLNFRRRFASSGPMLPRQHDEAVDLVIDGQMSGFMDTLACDGDHQLKVISIVGSGGLGKTTFARMLYNKIRGQFDCRAYVSMTRKPNIKKVLRDILTQVQRQEARDDCEDLDITGTIRKHLLGKRYLIVTDDLWAASAWNIITRAFPEGSQRSRIIVTTQVVDVALTCCCYQPELVFEMKPLDVYHSRKLFFNKIFGSESDCPEMFKEVSYKIVDRCGGSPLATTNMASLLASHSVLLMEQWAYISGSLSTMLRRSSTSEGMRLVLNLSYNNLSHYLKSCLLYLTKYPEGCIICTDDLVKQWVAEGFIEAIEGRDMECVARSYFDELIDRRFIQPACIKYNNEIVSCTVHDTVYDLIAYNSAEENFVMVVDTDKKNVNLSDKVRRLSLNFGDAIYAKKPRNIRSSHIRSLAFSGFFACMPSVAEFKLLRVLNLQLSGHRGDDILDLTGISELFQLRYLKVVSDVCIKLPKHIRGLQHLETLDMDAKVTAVPWDIIHLPCLWHLHLPLETNLMDWISDMRSDIVRRLDKLTNMRDLRITCSTPAPNRLEKNMEALGSLLRGLGNLEMLALVPGSSHENTVVCGPSEVVVSWDGFTPPLHLKRFEWSLCSCIFSRVPKWTGEFGNLCVLKIMVKELLRDGVDILKGLPALTALSLYVHAATVERIVFDKAGFLALNFFKFRCSVPWLKFEADAMPNLLKLKLGFNANRVDQHRNTHIIIEHLPCLTQIYVKIGGAGATAESALRAAVINHPSNPSINIQLADWMFFGHEGRSRATEDKEQDDIVKETAEGVSWEHVRKQAIIRNKLNDLAIKSYRPSVTPSHLHVSGKRKTGADSALSKAQLQDGYVGYPWDKKMRDMLYMHNSSCYLSMLVLPKALDSNACRYESFEDTLARANAWLYSSQASGVPIDFMSVQSEALLTKISGETASATVNSGSLSDLSNVTNATLYGFDDYHGVVKAARLWYSCVAGELLLEIPLEEGDTKLGFAISRTEEGFIFISSVVNDDKENKAPSTRSGLRDLFNRAKEASKLLVISRVSNEKVLPWIISSTGAVRCFDTISLSQKLSLHCLALRPIQLHLLAWEKPYGPAERTMCSPKLPPPSMLPQQHQNLMESGVGVEEAYVGDLLFRLDDLSFENRVENSWGIGEIGAREQCALQYMLQLGELGAQGGEVWL